MIHFDIMFQTFKPSCIICKNKKRYKKIKNTQAHTGKMHITQESATREFNFFRNNRNK